jgi:hypothetical protein
VTDEPGRHLSAEQVAYYRRVLVVHANRKETGACDVCRVYRCADWRHAYDLLAAGGHLMADPGAWDEPDGGRRWSR